MTIKFLPVDISEKKIADKDMENASVDCDCHNDGFSEIFSEGETYYEVKIPGRDDSFWLCCEKCLNLFKKGVEIN